MHFHIVFLLSTLGFFFTGSSNELNSWERFISKADCNGGGLGYKGLNCERGGGGCIICADDECGGITLDIVTGAGVNFGGAGSEEGGGEGGGGDKDCCSCSKKSELTEESGTLFVLLPDPLLSADGSWTLIKVRYLLYFE